MAQNYGPRITQDGLVMSLDPSQNKSYPAFDLPVKDGLVMWMDANDDSTFSYSSGTTVTQWRDKSGLNNHCVPLTAGPTRSSFLNSRKVLAFTTGQSIGSLSFTMETSAYTIFGVTRLTGTTNARVLTAYYNNWLLGHWGGLVNPYYAEGWVYYPPNSADAIWRIHMGDWGGPSNDLAATYSNGTVLTSGSTVAAAGPKGLGINFQGGEPSTCEAAEIIVFNRLLSTKERNLIHTYLGQKWGISNTDRQIFDLSGNNFNFSFNGTNPRYNAKTIVSNFDATSPFAVSSFGGQNLTSNILNLLYSDHTIEVAFNPKGFQSVYNYDNSLTTQNAQGIILWTGRHSGLRVYQNTIIYEYWNSQSSTVGISVSISSYQDKIIYITATRTGDTLRLYINGVLSSGPTTVAATTSPVSYSQINIGAAYQGNPTTQGYIWAGQHEYHLLRMYNRQLTDTEVASNYQAFKARFDNNIVRFGLVLDLDAGNPYSYAGAGSDWFDVSGNNNTSLLVGTTLPTFSNTNDGILIYDGNTQYSRTPSPSNNFAWTPSGVGLNNMTIDLWIKTTDGSGTILSKPWSGNGEYNFVLGHQGFAIVIGNQTNTLGFSSILTGNWINLVIVVSPTQYGAYINGVQNAALTNHGITNNTPTYGNGQVELTLMTFYPYGGAGNPGFSTQGNIGSFRIYNRVLSAAQVLQNYNATKGRFGL